VGLPFGKSGSCHPAPRIQARSGWAAAYDRTLSAAAWALVFAAVLLGGGFAVEVEAESSDGIAKRLSALPGVRSVEAPAPGRFRMVCDRDLRAEAAAAVVAAGGRLKQLSLDEPSLEEIYTRYFQTVQQGEARHAA